MITTYKFDPNTAELYEKIQAMGPYLVERTTYGTLRLGPLNYVEVFVSEGLDARREMFDHFDDSSWPEGWYRKLIAPLICKLALMPEGSL